MRLLKIWWVSDAPLSAENIKALRAIHQEVGIFPERKNIEDISSFIVGNPRDFVYIDYNLANEISCDGHYGIVKLHECRNKDGSLILSDIWHVLQNGRRIRKKVWTRPNPNGEGIVVGNDF